jgi:hypothetical protein
MKEDARAISGIQRGNYHRTPLSEVSNVAEETLVQDAVDEFVVRDASFRVSSQ